MSSRTAWIILAATVAFTPLTAQQRPIAPCVAAAPARTDPAPQSSADSTARAQFVGAVSPCMVAMHEGMRGVLDAPSTGTADAAFVGAMIPHHQGAIDMARQLILYGRDPAIRSFALSVIADQQAEIDLMRQWLRANDLAENRKAIQSGSGRLMTSPAAVPPITARDRVYTADQVSNTVSVIDPAANKTLGVIRLGNRRPDLLSPLYKGQINVHGLGVSPDGRTLAVISTGSNAVTLIATATNEIVGTVYVGRNPHEGFFSPDGRELWVTVRGESHVAVIDPVAMKVVDRIATAAGPGMVVFRPDGKVAFVDHSFTPELDVVDVATHRVIKRIPVVSPFSPNLAVTGDGQQVWLTHKDVGKVTVVNAQTFAVEGVIETGPVTNHVNFAGPGGGTRSGGAAAGDFAYVTVGGQNAVKVFRRDRSLVATIPVGAVPHGIWPSGDGSRIYVGLQQADSVAVIDTRTNTKVGAVAIGQSPQAVVYVVDAVPTGPGTSNLSPLEAMGSTNNVALTSGTTGGAKATVTIRGLGPVDGIDVSAMGLQPSQQYTLFLRTAEQSEPAWPLAAFRADSMGKANVEAIAPTTIPRPKDGRGSELILVAGASPRGAAVLKGRIE
jgi:YVTN family beta-propeller protein